MSIWEDLKFQWQQRDNGLIKLIIVNVAIFIFVNLCVLISRFSSTPVIEAFVKSNLALPADFWLFLQKPWTLITTIFTHYEIFHILWNMLFLWWFGKIVWDLLGNRRSLNIFFLGGIFGSICYLLAYNLIPVLTVNNEFVFLIGASGAVYAISVAAATLVPDHTFNLIFIGPVKIKWIVAFFLFVSLMGTIGDNVGGNIVHLSGALFGYIYIKQLRRGVDLARPFNRAASWFSSLGKPRLKVSKGGAPVKPEPPDQGEIDRILDKIGKSGYESLTKTEKEKLFKASQK